MQWRSLALGLCVELLGGCQVAELDDVALAAPVAPSSAAPAATTAAPAAPATIAQKPSTEPALPLLVDAFLESALKSQDTWEGRHVTVIGYLRGANITQVNSDGHESENANARLVADPRDDRVQISCHLKSTKNLPDAPCRAPFPKAVAKGVLHLQRWPQQDGTTLVVPVIEDCEITVGEGESLPVLAKP